ncbi:glycosyltransferase [Chloroflexi bacterium TSY]|nr:glycosyltransferase [Chloroflexi bacterium TSY]
MDVSVILPTFNERDNICDLIDAINQELVPTDVRFELLVMDDSSPDGTAEIVEERYDLALHEANSSKELIGPLHQNGVVRVCIRTQNRGLANSIRDGLERASGQTLVVMDTDFNHDPAMIPQMVELLRYYDLVIGSRFVMHGGMEEATRYWASFLYNVFIRILFQTKIQDNLSGFFAIRTERLFELEPQFDQVFYGYGDYFIRLLLLAWRKKWRILEVPVFYVLRRHGESKTGFWSIFREYTMAVLKLRFFGL